MTYDAYLINEQTNINEIFMPIICSGEQGFY